MPGHKAEKNVNFLHKYFKASKNIILHFNLIGYEVWALNSTTVCATNQIAPGPYLGEDKKCFDSIHKVKYPKVTYIVELLAFWYVSLQGFLKLSAASLFLEKVRNDFKLTHTRGDEVETLSISYKKWEKREQHRIYILNLRLTFFPFSPYWIANCVLLKSYSRETIDSLSCVLVRNME